MKDESVLSFEALRKAADAKDSESSSLILSTLWETVTEESTPIEEVLHRVARTAAEAANSVKKSVFQAMLGRVKKHRSGKPESISRSVDLIMSLCEELIASPDDMDNKDRIDQCNKKLEADLISVRRELEAATRELKQMRHKYLTDAEIRDLVSYGTAAIEEFTLLATRSGSSSRRTHRFDDANKCERCKLSLSDLIARRIHRIMSHNGDVFSYEEKPPAYSLGMRGTPVPRPSLLFCSGDPGTAIMAGLTEDMGVY